jgi:hypothetical protein
MSEAVYCRTLAACQVFRAQAGGGANIHNVALYLQEVLVALQKYTRAAHVLTYNSSVCEVPWTLATGVVAWFRPEIQKKRTYVSKK